MRGAYLDVNFVGGGYELLEFRGCFVQSWGRDVGHKDVGAFFGEENTCFETNSTEIV